MVTVTLKRAYYDATHFGTDENGVLRVYRGEETIAQYEAGAEITVSQEAPALALTSVEWTDEQVAEFKRNFEASMHGGRLT